MKRIIVCLLALVQSQLLKAQSVGIGTTTPNSSAVLDLTSTTKSLLIPRMTSAQRQAIPSPTSGMIVFQTNNDLPAYPFGFYIHYGAGAPGGWKRIAKSDEDSWTVSGGFQYSNYVPVGIGTTTPHSSAALDITSIDKGFLLPRMSTGQREAIPTPSEGLMVFDSQNRMPWIFDGVAWLQMNSNWERSGANMFSRNNGNVGIGTFTPEEKLHVANGNLLLSGGSARVLFREFNGNEIGSIYHSSDDLRFSLHSNNTAGRLVLYAQGEDRFAVRGTATTSTMELNQGGVTRGSLTANSSGDISLFTSAVDGLVRINTQLYVNASQNRVGIGTSLPTETFHVAGNALIASGGILYLQKSTGLKTVEIKSTESGSDGASMLLYNNAGVATIEIDADFGDGDGRIITSELQIRGGSDLAENFDINEAEEKIVKPGMLVSIDTKKEGLLCITNQEYDKKIVGVISGANGIKPGMLMGQQGTVAYGKYPVALAGRVYVLCDEEGGEINAGDFLTSSSKHGYAKKATDLNNAQGAIIGKAMGKADPKTGYVLVLINLQ